MKSSLSHYDETCKRNIPKKKFKGRKNKRWCYGEIRKFVKEKSWWSKWWSMKRSDRKNKVIKKEYTVNSCFLVHALKPGFVKSKILKKEKI